MSIEIVLCARIPLKIAAMRLTSGDKFVQSLDANTQQSFCSENSRASQTNVDEMCKKCVGIVNYTKIDGNAKVRGRER